MSTNPLTYLERLENRIEQPGVPPVTTGVLGVALTLWLALLAGWVPMPDPMELSMSAPGAMERAATGGGPAAVAAYLVAWGTMMAAMMYPAMIPYLRSYARSVEAEPADLAVALGAFLLSYALAWTAVGVVPLAIDALVDVHAVATSAPALVYGGLLVFAGGYQLSAFKHVPLQTCCRPATVSEADPRTALRLGLEHGRSCVLATWALFAFLVFVGSMNVFWMAVLTALVAAERLPHWGPEVANAVGVLAVLAGTVLLLPVPFPFP